MEDLPRSGRPSTSLTELNIAKVKHLNFLQKLNRVKVTEDMLERVNSDPTLIKRIETGDETWVYDFDMQSSQEASE